MCPSEGIQGLREDADLAEVAEMRAGMLSLLACFLILLAVAGGACAHGPSMVPAVAPDQGKSGGDGGGGGY